MFDPPAGYGGKSTLREHRLPDSKEQSWPGRGQRRGQEHAALSRLGAAVARRTVSGEALLRGRNLLPPPEKELRRIRGKEIALTPQSPMMALNAAISLHSHFQKSWKAHQKFDRAALTERVCASTAEGRPPSDPEFLRRRPGEISVGQAQRVLIALGPLISQL